MTIQHQPNVPRYPHRLDVPDPKEDDIAIKAALVDTVGTLEEILVEIRNGDPSGSHIEYLAKNALAKALPLCD